MSRFRKNLESSPLVVTIYRVTQRVILRIRSRRFIAFVKSHFVWRFGHNPKFENRYEVETILRHDWYHDFSRLGVKTRQIPSRLYTLNQIAKQDELFRLIDNAISMCSRRESTEITAVELFCADGFYSNYLASKGVTNILGVDLDADSVEKRSGILRQARLITKLLDNSDKISFRKANVFDVAGSYDICICAGGLYHLTNPQELLENLVGQVKTALVLQTVVSLEFEDPDYFVTPAPGLTWGCRFSFKYLETMLHASGWEIVEQSRNELPGCLRACDRGSAFMMCRPCGA